MTVIIVGKVRSWTITRPLRMVVGLELGLTARQDGDDLIRDAPGRR